MRTGRWAGPILMLEEMLRVCAALLVGELVRFFEDESVERSRGWLVAAGLLLLSAGIAQCHNAGFWITWRGGMQARCMMQSVVYKKVLRLSLEAFSDTSGSMSQGHSPGPSRSGNSCCALLPAKPGCILAVCSAPGNPHRPCSRLARPRDCVLAQT